MDFITRAIMFALANLSKDAIKASYANLKTALEKKLGSESGLIIAINLLEEEPESQSRKAKVQEEVGLAKVNDDPELHKLALKLLDAELIVQHGGDIGSSPITVKSFNYLGPLYFIRRVTDEKIAEILERIRKEPSSIPIEHPTPTRGKVSDSSSDSRASSQPRYLQADVPERVRIGEKVDLLVQIALLPNDASATAPLRPFAIPPEGIDVKITVQSPNFSIQHSTSQSLHVSPDRDSDPLLFELTALKEGVHKLEILAFNGGAYLGSLFVQITVDSLVQTGQAVRQFGFMLAREAYDGEATLTIKYTSDNKYRYVLRSKSIGETDDIETGPLARPRSAAVEDFVGTLNAIATGAMQMSPQQARLLLKGKGITLWKELIPKELERTFWNNRDTIKQLRIVSSQDPIPWEVLYPQSDNGDDSGFLAEQFPVTRWRPGPPARSALRVSAPLYVVPEGSPGQALGEVIELRKVLGSGRLINELDPLLEELETPNFDLLHFACHNTFLADKPDSSFIKMGQYYFMPDQVVGIGKSLEQSAPLVFMNACRTAGSAPAYTQLSGWADKFLDAGASAFVGSLWEIRDKSAPIFAAALYEALMDGTTLGEAMLRARLSIQEETDDPTWLAYTLYGDPAATVAKEG